MPAHVRIVSHDLTFAEVVGSRLEGPDVDVAVESDPERLTPSLVRAEGVDLVLLAVDGHDERHLRWLQSVKRALPGLEVILLNLAGEIRVSIEGMRAGASKELTAPFDLTTLRRAVTAALRRRTRKAGRPRASLAERFERAMAAAAFAEAGEPGTARSILEEREDT